MLALSVLLGFIGLAIRGHIPSHLGTASLGTAFASALGMAVAYLIIPSLILYFNEIIAWVVYVILAVLIFIGSIIDARRSEIETNSQRLIIEEKIARGLVPITQQTTQPATQPAPHPIDRYLETCIEKDSTTAGIGNCVNKAYSMWDKELNLAYATLMSSLAPTEQQTLRNAQRKWISYRDAEFKVMAAIYTNGGTVYITMRQLDALDLLKSRVLQLQGYLTLVQESKGGGSH